MDLQFSRTQILLGDEAMQKLQNARVAVFGIGGVGGYTAEALARSGIGSRIIRRRGGRLGDDQGLVQILHLHRREDRAIVCGIIIGVRGHIQSSRCPIAVIGEQRRQYARQRLDLRGEIALITEHNIDLLLPTDADICLFGQIDAAHIL